jgi:hypothetical protein
MTRGQLATHIKYFLFGVLMLPGLWPTPVRAQAAVTATATSQHHEATPAHQSEASGLVKVIREATARFRDVSVAEAEDYHLLFGCVSGSDTGAMGLHYANTSLVFDDELDPTRPEIMIYEPTSDGRLRLVGADFLILAEAWHRKHPATETPQIMGQLLHLFESPNRFGLPAFYTLHVWAWKENPNGMFVNWHRNVSCDAFRGQNP